MGYILVIWAAIGTYGDTYRELKSWMVIGEFGTQEKCIVAAHQLGISDETRFRCLQK